MSNWKNFYDSVKGSEWPECNNEENFVLLPIGIQQELINTFGYIPGSYKKQSKLQQNIFPINTKTACQLKWNWSTIFLTTETTASCHRTNAHKFDYNSFNFHNTPEKIADRQKMLQGQWPDKGCNYCKQIEEAGGTSDRITNLDLQGMHMPPELETDLEAVNVTPRILEVYFDNVCNLKCLYCGPHFSSLWDAENIQFGFPAFKKSINIETNKNKIFEWLKINGHHLTSLNVLGGEPLYQKEFEDCLKLFESNPAPELKLQIFTNLNIKLDRLKNIIEKIKNLVSTDKIREFEITASLDCWGKEQEYVRYPLDLILWEQNFNYLLTQEWINLIIGSTVTPLTIKTLPDLVNKINQWNKIRTVYHYQNSVNYPTNQLIDIFGNIFAKDFEKAINLKPETTAEEISSKKYLEGIAKQSQHKDPNVKEIKSLFMLLNELDFRRGTSWKETFPWLIDEFAKYNLYA
jgi:organic radical activating enzyme